VAQVGWTERTNWFITRHDDVERVLRDAATFSSRVNADTMGPVMGTVILAMDGDEHRRYRDLVAKAFRPSTMERWEREFVVPAIDALLDRIAPKGRADLVDDLTSKYPVLVITGIVGVPVEDSQRFHHWAEEINLGPQDWDRSLPASKAMREYLTPIVEARRANPCGDLVSDLVTAEITEPDGTTHRLDDEHIYGFLRLLLPAGAETTYRALGNCLTALLTDPPLLERVRADRSLIPTVIEETLRWETSVTMVNRETTCPVEIAGTPIPAGASLICLTGSANRDERRYDDPERFDATRAAKPHLAFGTGRHQCLGMHLARTEMRVGINAVLDRLPNLRLDPDAPPPVVEGFAFRSPARLEVLFDPS
jgi:cytochrome P450